jgi:hypothetical protein
MKLTQEQHFRFVFRGDRAVVWAGAQTAYTGVYVECPSRSGQLTECFL